MHSEILIFLPKIISCGMDQLYIILSVNFCFREKYKNDYDNLKKQLKTLPEKVTHDVMVRAFYKRTLVLIS